MQEGVNVDIGEGVTLADIRKQVGDMGLESSDDELFNSLKFSLFIERLDQIKEALSQDFPIPEELPCTEVKDKGVFRVHGILHQPSDITHPFSEDVRRFISSFLTGPHKVYCSVLSK